MMEFTHELLIIGVMLLFNAIFAAYEMALASISQARLLAFVNQKRRGAVSALHMKERMEASLAVVQVGITLVGVIAAATGGVGVGETLAPYLQQSWHISHRAAQAVALVFFVVPLSAITIVFGELIPKVFAIENKEWVCLRLSPVMRWLAWIAWPVVNFFEWCVKSVLRWGKRGPKRLEEMGDISGLHELHAAVSLARTKRLMGAQEERIVLSAAQLSRRKIYEIILPASEISMVPAKLSLTDALLRAHLDLHTRFPISTEENNPQTITGYITFKDLVTALKMHAALPTVEGIARPIKRIPGETVISQVLEQMMREKLHIALVVSKSDQVLGLVTLEDIIEELVGDIEDEEDSLPIHTHPTSGGWIMGGGVPIAAVASRLGVSWSPTFSGPRNLRLADWCVQILGRPLKRGETVRAEGLQVTVRKMRRRKLAEAFVSKALSTIDMVHRESHPSV